MALTISSVEAVLAQRLSALVTLSAISTTVIYDDPIAWALRRLGYTTAAVGNATDGEVGVVTGGAVDALLDLAELRTLETLQQQIQRVTTKAGPVQENWNDLREALKVLVPEKRKAVSAMHGHLLAYPLDATDKRAVQIAAL
jgi:hypothetical protein